MRHLIATILVATLFLTSANAQYQLGLRLETYAGVNSLPINPAGNLNNPNKWDINLTGIGIFLQNNYFYLEDASLSKFAFISHSIKNKDKNKDRNLSDYYIMMDFFDDDNSRFINSMAFISGPSLAVRLGKNISIGAFYNMRYMIGGKDLPNELSYYKFKSKSIVEQLAIPKLNFSMLNWSEIGLNLAKKIPTINGSLNFGVSLKYLQGHQGGYAKTNEPYYYGNLPETKISLRLPDGQLNFAGDLDKSKLMDVNGKGIGADLGFTYIFQDHAEEGFKLKIGASLLDMGRITFKKNTQVYQLNIDTNVVVDLEKYKEYSYPSDLDKAIHDFSDELLKENITTDNSQSFSMSLPAAFSLQADYGVTGKIYLNALIIQQLASTAKTPLRRNILALTPRWQTKWFSASAPISLNDWNKLQVGLGMRLSWLVIGTEDFASTFFNKNFTGGDFYIAVKINTFKN
ncbi:MAG: hypothetical protein GC192_11895 [Bacteroidetes bacterium]|nr:hypothetical protein [Bacteroidota bacterium]